MKLGELFAAAKKKNETQIENDQQLGKKALKTKVKAKGKTAGGTNILIKGLLVIAKLSLRIIRAVPIHPVINNTMISNNIFAAI